jgi:lysophospholipase L1-like esterase
MTPRRSALGLVALALLVGAGDDPTVDDAVATTSTTAEGSPTIRPELIGADDAVLFVGDSLTVGATDIGGLEDRLHAAGFDDVDVIAEEGRDAAWGLGEIEALQSVPPLVVVELGTNRSANPAGFPEVVDEIVAALHARGALHIAWVTPVFASDERYRDKADLLEQAEGIDLIGRWDAPVHDDPGIISSDGLHPTEAGYGRLARFLATTASDLAAT